MADVTFSDRFEALSEAFGGFHYVLEKRAVPQDDPMLAQQVAESDDIEGERASNLDVLGGRLRRRASYLEEDLGRVDALSPLEAGPLIRSMELAFGAPFSGVTNLVVASNAISAVGTMLSSLADFANTPQHEAQFQFDEPGMYVVRVGITPVLDEASVYRRAAVWPGSGGASG